MKNVLESPLAGSWYPADATQLRAFIDQAINDHPPVDLGGPIGALILPHAGYTYSGAVACAGLAHLRGSRYRRVVILGPTHSVALPGRISVPTATHYATPLGETALDTAFIARLLAHREVTQVPAAHQREHSVQIELPLLQHLLPAFELVPIVVGQLDADAATRIGGILRELVDDDTLVVVSTDFTHYGDRFMYTPFADDVADNLHRLDMGAFKTIAAKDLDGFHAYIDRTGATVCGRHPLSVLLAMLDDNHQVHLVHYDTSGNILGDHTNSVSYLAAAVTGSWPTSHRSMSADGSAPVAATLDQPARSQLLALARQAIAYQLERGHGPTLADLDTTLTEPMHQVLGAFVTLHKDGHLRGCIGEIEPHRPVHQAVLDQAGNAAFHDPRFPPVRSGELADIHIEISALHPPRSVDSHDDIVLGRHGIVLSKDGHRAVFLPQVAPEQGWDLEQTLAHLARKAGLNPDAWRQGCRFEVFEAEVFGE